MVSKVTVCPDCGKGILDSEKTESRPNGDHIETYYYSCGHSFKYEHFVRASAMSTPALKIDASLIKMRSTSEEKIRNKPVNEIENKFRRNDVDDSEKLVIETYCKCRYTNPTSIFQVVKYENGKLKHIHCKTCGNQWEYSSERPIENQFIFKFISDEKVGVVSEYLRGIKIQCLTCNAKYEHINRN